MLSRAERDAAASRAEARRLQRVLRRTEARLEDTWAHVDALDAIIASLRQQIDTSAPPPALSRQMGPIPDARVGPQSE